MSFRPIASSTFLSRNAGMTPRAAEKTISARTPPSRRLYGTKRRADAAQVRPAHRRVGRPLRRRIGGVEEHAHALRLRGGSESAAASFMS